MTSKTAESAQSVFSLRQPFQAAASSTLQHPAGREWVGHVGGCGVLRLEACDCCCWLSVGAHCGVWHAHCSFGEGKWGAFVVGLYVTPVL